MQTTRRTGAVRRAWLAGVWLMASGLSALAVRTDEDSALVTRADSRVRPPRVSRTVTDDQRDAARVAEKSDIQVEWHRSLGTPMSVRGSDLGRRQAYSGGKGLTTVGGRAYERDAIAVVDNLARLFRLKDAEAEFQAKKAEPDALGFHHVRLTQVYRGLRVFGGDLIVHFDRKGTAYQVNGGYVAGIVLDVTPGIAAAEAVKRARQDLAGLEKPEGNATGDPTLVVYARGGEPRLAYELVLAYRDPAAAPGRWRYWIDAMNGAVLLRYNDIKTIAPPTPNGVVATITGSILGGEGGGVTNVAGWYENANSSYYLYDTNLLWYVCNVAASGYLDANTYAYRTTSNWGASDRTEMSAARNFAIIQRYYRDVEGRHSFDDMNHYAEANVHEGEDYVNAFWDSGSTNFNFGDGDRITAGPLAVLDVSAHEFTHAVTEYSANLIYADESGAINESFSDVMGAVIEFREQPDGRANYPSKVAGTADWLLGEDCWLSSVALRDMRCPSNTATVGAGNEQPTRYSGTFWDEYGEVHQNAGPQNFMFYLLAEGGSGNNDGVAYNVTGIGITNAARVAYRALTVYCTPDTDYPAARAAWASAAHDFNTNWANSAIAAWTAIGVGAMSVSPRGRVSFQGPRGGPYDPLSQTLVIANSSGQAMNWTVSHTQSWVTLSVASGSIPAGGSNTTVVSINANADGLSVGGLYVDTLVFSNTVEGLTQTRQVSLDIESSFIVTPAGTNTFRGPVGGPFVPAARTYTLTNRNAVALGWTVTHTSSWLAVSSSGGTLPGFGGDTMNIVTSTPAAGLTQGIHTDVLTFTNTADDVVETRAVTIGVGLPDYFTELFDEEDIDLRNRMLMLIPDGSGNGYSAFCGVATNFPIDPSGGTVLTLSDDDYATVRLVNGGRVALYGKKYGILFVGSNGYITFGSGDNSYHPSFGNHFSLARVSALFEDLDPRTKGTVSWKQLVDRAVVTFQNVPEYSTSNNNSFQIELCFDGTIRITWLALDATGGLAGLSRGADVPADFLESDITGYDPLPRKTLTVASRWGTPAPAVGAHECVFDSRLDCQVGSPVTMGWTQYVCTGWTMAGNEPTGGTTNAMSFSLTNDATLTWRWQTNYWLNATATAGGSINVTNGWRQAGANVLITATAAPHYFFSHWSGTTNGCVIASNTISVLMDAARQITANFSYDTSAWYLAVSTPAYSLTQPPAGTHLLPAGTITCFVAESPVIDGTRRYDCIGWTGSGSVPSPGTGTNTGVFTLSADSSISWLWQTNFWLDTQTNYMGGTVDVEDGWFLAGQIVTITATPASGLVFRAWSGDITGCSIADNRITVPMDQPRVIVASFHRFFYVNDASVVGDAWCTAIGDDTNSGVYPSAPKLTVQKVISDYELGGGDVVRIDTGVYNNTGGNIFISGDAGSSDAQLVFEASPYGVTLNRGSSSSSNFCVWQVDANYVTLRTAWVTNRESGGRRFMVVCGGYDGVRCKGDHMQISGMDICSNKMNGINLRMANYAEIKNCVIGKITDTTNSCGIYSWDSDNLSIRNTTIYNIPKYGFYMTNGSVSLTNNIVLTKGSGAYGLYIAKGTINGTDYNNLYPTNTAKVGYRFLDKNTLAAWQSASGGDGHSLSVDPLFVNAAGFDYHLCSSAPSGTYVNATATWTNYPGQDSLCIDMGDPTLSCADEPAPNGHVVDMGAYGNTPQASRSMDTDSDGLSDIFETYRYGTSPTNVDMDADGFCDGNEYWAGTDPTNALSLLELKSATRSGSGFAVVWSSVTNRWYRVTRSTNDLSRFDLLQGGIQATPPENTYTDTAPNLPKAFYRVGVDP